MLLKIKVTPKFITKYFDTNGNSLSSVFTNTSETMSKGTSYSGKNPPTNPNYTYYGYSKSTQDDVSPSLATASTSKPPSFVYDGESYNAYVLHLYYKKSVPASSGVIHIRHMTRTGSSGSFSKAAEEENVVSLPYSGTVNPKTSYGTVVGSSQGTYAYSELMKSDKSQTVSLVKNTKEETWVTFFYEKVDYGVTGDFDILPGSTLTYGDAFSLVPKNINLKSCTFQSIQFQIEGVGDPYLTYKTSSVTEFVPFFTKDDYPWTITGPGSYPVSMVIHTSCGDTWVGPKTLYLKDPPPEPVNNPPYANIAWFEAGTEEHVIRVAQGSKVDLKVVSMSDPDEGDSASIVGWDMSDTDWLSSLQDTYHYSPTANAIPSITADTLGTHVVKLTVADSKGLTFTASATLIVVDPRPVAVIDAPAIVKENHPLPSPISGSRSYSPAKLPIVDYVWSANKPAEGETFHSAGTETLTLKVEDSIGRWSDLATKDVIVTPDEPPVVNLQVPSEETRTGQVTVVSNAYSPDGDTVVRHVFFRKYDSDNNGFSDDSWVQVQDGASGQYTFTPNRVGKYLFGETAYENYGKSGNSDSQPETQRTLDVLNLPPTVDVSATSNIPNVPNPTTVSISDLYNNGLFTSLETGGSGNKGNYELVNGILKSKIYKKINVMTYALTSNLSLKADIDGMNMLPFRSAQGTLVSTSLPDYLKMASIFADEQFNYSLLDGEFTAYDKQWNQQWTTSLGTGYILYFNSTQDRLIFGFHIGDTLYNCSGMGCNSYSNDKLIVMNKSTGELMNANAFYGMNGVIVTKNEVWVTAYSSPTTAAYYNYRHDLDGNYIGEAMSSSNAGYSICEVPRVYSFTFNTIVASLSNDMPRCVNWNTVINLNNMSTNYSSLASNPTYFDRDGNLATIKSTTNTSDYNKSTIDSFDNYNQIGIVTSNPIEAIPDLSVTQYGYLPPGKSTNVLLAHSTRLLIDQDNRYWFYTANMANLSSTPHLIIFDSKGNYAGNVEVAGQPTYYYQGLDGLITIFIPYYVSKPSGGSYQAYRMEVIDPKTLTVVANQTVPMPSPYSTEGFYGKILPVGNQTFVFYSDSIYTGGHAPFSVSSNASTAYPNIVDIGKPTKDLILGDSIPQGNNLSFNLSASQVSNEGIGYAFFGQNSKNYYSVEFEDGELRVKKTVNGSASIVFSKPYSLVEGKDYGIKIMPESNGFGVYVNRIKQSSITESVWKSGKVGVINRGQQGAAYTSISYYAASGVADVAGNIAITGEPITYVIQWDDEENDPKLIQADQWVFTHDPSGFLNPPGTWSESGKTLAEAPSRLDLPGDYTYTFSSKDDPQPEHLDPDTTFDEYRQKSNQVTGILRVHRPPVETLSIAVNDDNTVSYLDQSYDPDRYDPSTGAYSSESTGIDYETNHGIVRDEYQYRTPGATAYIEGKPSKVVASGVYTIQHVVYDEYGAWDMNVYTINVDSIAVQPPIAGFTVTPLKWIRYNPFVIDSTASDPQDGDRTKLEHQYYIRNVSTGGAETLQSDSRTTWEKMFNSLGIMSIRQIVTNSYGLTAEATQTVEVVNQKPNVTVTTPSSSSESSPTLIRSLRPTFEWAFQDDDDDRQDRYHVMVYRSSGTLVKDFGVLQGTDTSFIPTIDLPENTTMYVTVQVYDEDPTTSTPIEASDWSTPKYFVLKDNHKPVVNVTTPSSSTASSPTLFTVLRPSFVWTYADQDGDPETQYRVQVLRVSDGTLQLDSGIKTGASLTWAASADLPENVTMYVQVQAYDGLLWSDWSPRKYFTIQTNRPPTGDFSWTPDPAYEGDTVAFSPAVDDPDRDPLAVTFRLTSPSGNVVNRSLSSTYPYSTAGPDVRMLEAGNWTVRMTASDGIAPEVTVQKTVPVRPLGLTGRVRHTDAWEANRLHYNEEHPDAPRPADWFWAGEAFVLEADATDTGSSATKATRIVADAGNGLRLELQPVGSSGSVNWTGRLGSREAGFELRSLEEGEYTFVFTVTYSNGVEKTATAAIRIQDTVDSYVSVHRIQ